jgi:hypothetical protein
MPVLEEQVPITLTVPRSVAERVGESARLAKRSIEEEAEALMERGLSTRESVRASADRAYQAFRDHLKRTGQKEPTADELMEQMRRIREDISNELDPD